MFIPIHKPQHWVFLVVFLKEKKIIYFDSLAIQNKTAIENIKNYLNKLYKNSKDVDNYFKDWPVEYFFKNQLQQNGNDCGVYVLSMAEYVLNEKKFDLKDNDMNEFRKKICYELITQTLINDIVDENILFETDVVWEPISKNNTDKKLLKYNTAGSIVLDSEDEECYSTNTCSEIFTIDDDDADDSICKNLGKNFLILSI